jgi:hypothetical protein
LFTSIGLADCLAKVAAVQSWPSPTEQTLSCLTASQEFNEGMATLCVQDKSDISETYQKYLAYQEVYKSAVAKFKAAQDIVTRTTAAIEMQNAKQDLNNYGLEPGIFKALDQVSSAHGSCTN